MPRLWATNGAFDVYYWRTSAWIRKRRREAADDSGKAQQRYDVEVGLHLHLLAQFLGGARVRRQQFFVYLHRRGLPRLHVHIDVEMSAMNLFANDLAEPQFVNIESFGHPKTDVEKAVIHALDADAQSPAVRFGACLRVAGHRDAFGFFRGGALRL